MRILCINCGSASLKFAVWNLSSALADAPRVCGSVAWSGDGAAELRFVDPAGASHHRSEPVAGHTGAVEHVIEWLKSLGELQEMEAVGHRVVHGGPRFHRAVQIDDAVLRELEGVSSLAPLHNPPALRTIRSSRELLPESIPMVAVFDTAFHRQMPQKAELYPLKQELIDQFGLRRYGFHGIAHRYMAGACARLIGRPLDSLRLITLQLGNGCSAAAVEGGHSVDTSMGFTPLEGLMMGTRCGDVDPGLVVHLLRTGTGDVDRVERMLNQECGLLGISGRSRDMRELLQAEAMGDGRAALAIEMFCYRVRKYVGAYLAVLGGADAVVFGGGIGENATEVRRRVCAGMEWAGLSLNAARNGAAVGVDARISADGSAVGAYTVAVREELLIARETAACVRS